LTKFNLNDHIPTIDSMRTTIYVIWVIHLYLKVLV